MRNKNNLTNISKDQMKDTGMAMVLILLLTGFFFDKNILFKIAVISLLINMIVPKFYYPFAIIWLGFSQILGTVVSKIILSVVFFVIVFPVALIRRMMGKDSLQLKQFKKSGSSVMKTRNHRFSSDDIVHPY